MTVSSKMLHIRVDDEMKSQADEAFKAMGLSMSEAVRLFLHQVVVDQALPFAIKVPNAKTRQAMKEADSIVANRRARFDSADQLFDELEKNCSK
jgi:DNA-damage-inducible protein J